jgi:hypothetical protein
MGFQVDRATHSLVLVQGDRQMGSQVNEKKQKREKTERERERERRERKEKEKRKKKKKVRPLNEWIFSKLGRQEDKFSLQSLLCKTLRSSTS